MNNGVFLSFILKTNPGIRGIIIQDTFRLARTLFNETEGILKQGKNEIKNICKFADRFTLELKNESRLIAIPDNPECLRGLSVDFFILNSLESITEEKAKIIFPILVSASNRKSMKFVYVIKEEILQLF